jgi:hypothetical protein
LLRKTKFLSCNLTETIDDSARPAEPHVTIAILRIKYKLKIFAPKIGEQMIIFKTASSSVTVIYRVEVCLLKNRRIEAAWLKP